MANKKENITGGTDYIGRYLCKDIFPLTLKEKKELKRVIRRSIRNAKINL